MSQCLHKNAVSVRGGLVRTEERLYNYETAWCPDCGAYRECAAFTTAEPWILPGSDLSQIPDRVVVKKVTPKKKKTKRKRKS